MMYGWTGGTGPIERGVQQGVGPFNTIPQVDWTFFSVYPPSDAY